MICYMLQLTCLIKINCSSVIVFYLSKMSTFVLHVCMCKPRRWHSTSLSSRVRLFGAQNERAMSVDIRLWILRICLVGHERLVKIHVQ